MNKCFICGNESNGIKKETYALISKVNCPWCGTYHISHEAEKDTRINKGDRIKISSVIRHQSHVSKLHYGIYSIPPDNAPSDLYPITIDNLISLFPQDVFKRAELALINLMNMSDYAGHMIDIDEKDASLFFPENDEYDAIRFIMNILHDNGFISGHIDVVGNIEITPVGWKKLYELERTNVESKQAFIAMWFDKSMDSAYIAIENAIRKAGFEPKRIDAVNHNNKICDQIIAEIKKSKFVISDFTGGRGGVYYEAGFAHGLGIDVIFTCKEDDLGTIHFDTRQFNHIVWSNANELEEKLVHRIEATIK